MIPTTKPESISGILTWVVLQLLLLGIGAGGFPLWAHHGFPREAWALQEMICGQVILIGLLFPIIAATGQVFAVNVALLLPMSELAGLLSNSPQSVIVGSTLCVCIWFASLWRCVRLARSSTSVQLITCLASVFTLGGAMLDYLRWEAFAADGNSKNFHPISLLTALCSLISASSQRAYVESCAPMICILALLIINRLQSPPTSPHHE